ncbi:MAG: DUF58 domain-containing protein [Bacteroidota bacterium]
MREILKKVRKLEIKVRRQVDSTFAGEYHSAFKGQGLEFDEVRPYQFGDDIRTIDWNVTARMGEVYIKTFREEREQTLFVLFDVSGSEDFGVGDENKRIVGTEIASLLAFSALKNNDKIGMATFSGRIETFFRPQKGRKHILAMVRSLLTQQPSSRETHLLAALDFVRKTLKRRSILLIVSDFLDKGYEEMLRQLARRHEVILIRLFHPNEVFRASAGTVPVMDLERQRQVWINAGDTAYRHELNEKFEQINKHLQAFSRRNGMDYLSLNTKEDYLMELEKFFRKRNRSRKGKNK